MSEPAWSEEELKLAVLERWRGVDETANEHGLRIMAELAARVALSRGAVAVDYEAAVRCIEAMEDDDVIRSVHERVVRRWRTYGSEEFIPSGDWIAAADYDRVVAERDNYKADWHAAYMELNNRDNHLAAEVERLRAQLDAGGYAYFKMEKERADKAEAALERVKALAANAEDYVVSDRFLQALASAIKGEL